MNSKTATKTLAGLAAGALAASLMTIAAAAPAQAAPLPLADKTGSLSCRTAQGTFILAFSQLSGKPQRKKGYAYTVSIPRNVNAAAGMKGKAKVLEDIPIAGAFLNWKVGKTVTTWLKHGETRNIPIRLYSYAPDRNMQWCDVSVTVTAGR